jgi:hypothetical protein
LKIELTHSLFLFQQMPPKSVFQCVQNSQTMDIKVKKEFLESNAVRSFPYSSQTPETTTVNCFQYPNGNVLCPNPADKKLNALLNHSTPWVGRTSHSIPTKQLPAHTPAIQFPRKEISKMTFTPRTFK